MNGIPEILWQGLLCNGIWNIAPISSGAAPMPPPPNGWKISSPINHRKAWDRLQRRISLVFSRLI
jgi:hypothetical protein